MTYTWRTSFQVIVSDSTDAATYDVDLTLRYTVYRGREATQEEPAEGASVSIQEALVAGEPAPKWLWALLERDDELQHEMLYHATEMDCLAREQAADERREERRLG